MLLSLYYAHKANINAGVITTLWAATPIFASFLDYAIYGQKLLPMHIFGSVTMTISGLAIGLSDINKGNDGKAMHKAGEPISSAVPVVFSLIAAVMFMVNSMFMKHLTQEKVGFEAYTVSYGTMGLTSVIILLVGIFYYWK